METLEINIQEKVIINESIGIAINVVFENRKEGDSFIVIQLPEYALILLEKTYSGLGSFSNSPDNNHFNISYEKSGCV
jgi:hypothetical protein